MRAVAAITAEHLADLASRLLPRGLFWRYTARPGTLVAALCEALGATLLPNHQALQLALDEAFPHTATAAGCLPMWEDMLGLTAYSGHSESERQAMAAGWLAYRLGLSWSSVESLARACGLSATLNRDLWQPQIIASNDGCGRHRKGRCAHNTGSILLGISPRWRDYVLRVDCSPIPSAAQRKAFEALLGVVKGAHVYYDVAYYLVLA